MGAAEVVGVEPDIGWPAMGDQVLISVGVSGRMNWESALDGG